MLDPGPDSFKIKIQTRAMIALPPVTIHPAFEVITIDDDIIRIERPISTGQTGPEKSDHRSASRRRQMHWTGVATDEDLGPSGQRIKLFER